MCQMLLLHLASVDEVWLARYQYLSAMLGQPAPTTNSSNYSQYLSCSKMGSSGQVALKL